MDKGIHLVRDYEAQKVNLLGCQTFACDDELQAQLFAGDYGDMMDVKGEYLPRFASSYWKFEDVFRNLRGMKNFCCKVQVLNEPAIARQTPEYAAQEANKIIPQVLDQMPCAYLILSMMTGGGWYPGGANAWQTKCWDLIDDEYKPYIKELAGHNYNGTVDGVYTYCVNRHNLSLKWGVNLPFRLTETGLGKARTDGPAFAQNLWNKLKTLPYVVGVHWLPDHAGQYTSGYLPLIANEQLTPTGVAWSNLSG